MTNTVTVGGQEFLKMPISTAKNNYTGALERLNALGKGSWSRSQGAYSYTHTLPSRMDGHSKIVVHDKATGRSVGELAWDPSNGHIGGFYIESDSKGAGYAAIGALHAAWTHSRISGTAGPIGTSSLTNWSFRTLYRIFPEWFEENRDTYGRERLMEEASDSGHSTFSAAGESDTSRDSGVAINTRTRSARTALNSMESNVRRLRPRSREDSYRDGEEWHGWENLSGVDIPRVARGRAGENSEFSGETYPTRSEIHNTADRFSSPIAHAIQNDVLESGRRVGTYATDVIDAGDTQGTELTTVAQNHFDTHHPPQCPACGGHGVHLFSTSLDHNEQDVVSRAVDNGEDVDDLLGGSDSLRLWHGVGHTPRAIDYHLYDNDVSTHFGRKLVVKNNDGQARIFAAVDCTGIR